MEIHIIPKYDMHGYESQLNELYHDRLHIDQLSLEDRIDFFSHRFLGRPYLLGALGEGEKGLFDQSPLYRFDCFDCLTYVNTVLALVKGHTSRDFLQQLLHLNYYDAAPTYIKRFHFVSIDWNIQNQNAGYLKDITTEITGVNGEAIVEHASTCIDKPSWVQHRNLMDIKLIESTSHDAPEELLANLHKLSIEVTAQDATISYVPIVSMFDADNAPISDIFDQIPHASIIEIVRPNWNLKEKIGTNMHVSHIGFAIRTKAGLMYRQASSEEKQVIDIPLERYLYQRLNSPTIKGINIQKVI